MPTKAPGQELAERLQQAAREPDLDLQQLIHRLRSKWRVVAVCTALTLLAALAYSLKAPKSYLARVVVQVEQSAENIASLQEVTPEDYKALEILKTVEQALCAESLLLAVIHTLKLDSDPNFAPIDGGPWTENALIEKLGKEVTTKLRRGTRLIDVEVRDHSAKRAPEIAEAIVAEYLRESGEQRLAVWKLANKYMSQQVQILKNNLEQSEQALQKFKEEHQAVSLEDRQNIIVERLKALGAQVTAVTSERLRLEADLAAVEASPAAHPQQLLLVASVAALPEVHELTRQLNDELAELAAVKSRYSAQHPKYVAQENKIQELTVARNRALAAAGGVLRQSYVAAQATEAHFATALQEQEKAALELNRLAIPYDVLQREVESNRALYDSLIKHVKESGITENFTQGFLRIVDSPRAPDDPVWPRKIILLPLALMAGLGIASGFVVLGALLDSSFSGVDQAEQELALPVLATIPTARPTLRKQFDARDAIADRFGYLQSFLRTGASGLERRTILLTSAFCGEGTSYCAAHFAAALAHQDLRVLLIDADLRTPSLHRLLKVSPPAGLAEILLGAQSLEQCLLPTSVPKLTLLAAGQAPPHATGLLTAARLRAMLPKLLSQFDRIVIDTAPVCAVSDTLNFGSVADAVCLVIRNGLTERRAALRACHLLQTAHAPPIGIILNGIPRGRGAQFAYYTT